MHLHILGSNSTGNSYILEGKTSTLIIECGLSLSKVKENLNFNLSNVCGALITHCHGDHAKFVPEYLKAGIDVCSSLVTLDEIIRINKFPYENCHRMRIMVKNKKYNIGEFIVMPFDITHDAPEPFGYLIKHDECGLVLFVTDTMYLKYKFPGLNQIIIEANYSQDILDSRLVNGDTIDLVRNRVISSHMEFNTTKDVLRVNDLKNVRTIVLIHLSDTNSDSALFKNEVEALTGKEVYVADKNMCIPFDINPF